MASAMLLMACQSDEELIEGSLSSDALISNPVYFRMNLASSYNTRSETTSESSDSYAESSDGYIEDSLEGDDYVINSMLLVMTIDEENQEKVKVKETIYDLQESLSSGLYTDFAISESALSLVLGKTVKIYVYCNPPRSLIEKEDISLDEIYSIEENGYAWEDKDVLFTSATKKEIYIPEDLSSYNSIDDPFSLGDIYVEHSFARYEIPTPKNGWTFKLPAYLSQEQISRGYEPYMQAEIEQVAIINLSNSFYFLRRVAQDNSGIADYLNPTLLATETSSSWVIDTDASEKLSLTVDALESNFYYPLSDYTSWQWIDIEDCNNAWHYLSENTPASTSTQKKGLSTGFVFKVKLSDVSGQELFNTLTENIVFDNVFYGSISQFELAAQEAGKGTKIYNAYYTLRDVWENNLNRSEIEKAAKELGITIYYPYDTDEFVNMYYYYFNEHNALDSASLGIMEFAVVRNNSYELNITDITGYGHPDLDISNNIDPWEIDPNDYNKDINTYLLVDINIMPWVKRQNSLYLE